MRSILCKKTSYRQKLAPYLVSNPPEHRLIQEEFLANFAGGGGTCQKEEVLTFYKKPGPVRLLYICLIVTDNGFEFYNIPIAVG